MDIILIIVAFIVTANLDIFKLLNDGDKKELAKYVFFTSLAIALSIACLVFVKPNSIAAIIAKLLSPVIKSK
jgi:hypothetical protein